MNEQNRLDNIGKRCKLNKAGLDIRINPMKMWLGKIYGYNETLDKYFVCWRGNGTSYHWLEHPSFLNILDIKEDSVIGEENAN